MKTQLLFVALLAISCLGAAAQAWVNPLPVEGTRGRVTYRGRVKTPRQSKKVLGARFALYAATELSHSTANAKIERGNQPRTIKGNGQRVLMWRGGAPRAAGRTLHYVLRIRPHDGYYDYKLSELTSETPAVPARGAPGAAPPLVPKTGAIEGVLRDPTNYDGRHDPTIDFRAYCEAVNATAVAVLADVQAALTLY